MQLRLSYKLVLPHPFAKNRLLNLNYGPNIGWKLWTGVGN